jgi:hypothetical protein
VQKNKKEENNEEKTGRLSTVLALLLSSLSSLPLPGESREAERRDEGNARLKN